MNRLLVLIGVIIMALVWTVQPVQAQMSPESRADFSCYTDSHTSDAYKSTGEGGEYVRYRWSLRILNQHCDSPTTYFDDIKELRVKGEIVQGEPECDGDVVGGWKTYRADVGSIRGFNPSEVSWNCTSSKSWSFTWDFPSNDNLYVGRGSDRCVGAHVRWVRPFYNDMADDIPLVCF